MNLITIISILVRAACVVLFLAATFCPNNETYSATLNFRLMFFAFAILFAASFSNE